MQKLLFPTVMPLKLALISVVFLSILNVSLLDKIVGEFREISDSSNESGNSDSSGKSNESENVEIGEAFVPSYLLVHSLALII